MLYEVITWVYYDSSWRFLFEYPGSTSDPLGQPLVFEDRIREMERDQRFDAEFISLARSVSSRVPRGVS